MKTSELIGSALDWAVAKCEGCEILITGKQINIAGPRSPFAPDEDWAQGGPIIEREKISLDALTGYSEPMWMANVFDYEDLTCRMYGPTPLIAAMRCYVASKLGDEVDIPEELV